MNFNPAKTGGALAVATLTVWLVCSLLVQLFPGMMLDMTSYMLHVDMRQFGWEMSATGALLGGIAWGISTLVFGWLFATAYNLFARK